MRSGGVRRSGYRHRRAFGFANSRVRRLGRTMASKKHVEALSSNREGKREKRRCGALARLVWQRPETSYSRSKAPPEAWSRPWRVVPQEPFYFVQGACVWPASLLRGPHESSARAVELTSNVALRVKYSVTRRARTADISRDCRGHRGFSSGGLSRPRARTRDSSSCPRGASSQQARASGA